MRRTVGQLAPRHTKPMTVMSAVRMHGFKTHGPNRGDALIGMIELEPVDYGLEKVVSKAV